MELFCYCLIIALKNAAIYASFQRGNIFGWLRITIANQLDRRAGYKLSKYIQKPLFSCFTCMASFWTSFWLLRDGVQKLDTFFQCILIVAGISFLFSQFINDDL